MNKPRKSFSLQEAKIQASILLKSLHSSDEKTALSAAKRFKRLIEFATFSTAELPTQEIKRKHALAVIAIENGFKSWADLKSQMSFIIGGFLNKWFTDYEEAKTHQRSNGGFLFPYKSQFFLCGESYIKQLGLNPKDPDWKRIDWDWANPADRSAWQRLHKKWPR